MAKFDRYLLSQLMVFFGFFALVLVMVYWVNQAVRLFEFLIADGQSAAVFLEFTALTLPNVIRAVLPIAAFVASVYTTNRLSSESELVVVQSMGFSGFRLARPVLAFGIIVAILTSVLTPCFSADFNKVAGRAQRRGFREYHREIPDRGQFSAPSRWYDDLYSRNHPQGASCWIFSCLTPATPRHR